MNKENENTPADETVIESADAAETGEQPFAVDDVEASGDEAISQEAEAASDEVSADEAGADQAGADEVSADEAGDEAESEELGAGEPAPLHEEIRQIVEGAILAADRPLSIDQLIQLFIDSPPSRAQIRGVLAEIEESCADRGFELKEVASGYRFQVRTRYGQWVSRLWEEKPPRYTRALLETLALIAYKQPITRGDIEEIRGVAVSTNIMRSLLEREWIRIVGHRDVPGRPALYATTRHFLDYFNLSSLEELPTLSEIKALEEVNQQLELVEEAPVTGRSIELDVSQQQEDDDLPVDTADLDAVTEKVNTIQENIRSLFREETDEDSLDDDELDGVMDGDEVASIDAEGTNTQAAEEAEEIAEVAEVQDVEATDEVVETDEFAEAQVADEVIEADESADAQAEEADPPEDSDPPSQIN